MSSIKTNKEILQYIINAVNNNKLSLERKKEEFENLFHKHQNVDESLDNNLMLKKIYTDIYLAKFLNYKNMIEQYDLYVERCKKYVEYFDLKEEDEIKAVGASYSLLDLIQKETIKKIKNDRAYKMSLIDLDDDCLAFFNSCAIKKIEVPKDILMHIIPSKDKLAIIESINKSELKEMEYKKIFIEESFEIKESDIERDLLFDFNIETVVDSLYNKKVIKDEIHTK